VSGETGEGLMSDADAEFHAALVECGRLIEAMPWDERHDRVDKFLGDRGTFVSLNRYARDLVVGMMVVAHEHRATMQSLSDILAERDATLAALCERWRATPSGSMFAAGLHLAVDDLDREWPGRAALHSDPYAALARVEELHHERGTSPESCDHCGHRWPCPTYTALHPDPGP
jgi:hypothetical protein